MVNNAPLVVFRVLFGLLMLIEGFGAIATGWVHRSYIEPKLSFPILTSGWPEPLPGHGMTVWFILLGMAAIGVMLGWRYRFSALALSVLWSGAYLTQKTNYNNHYYLAALLCWAMVFLPAHRRASLDARRTGQRETWCSSWIPFAFRLQTTIVFGFAALAKLHPSWLSGDFLAALFSQPRTPALKPLLQQAWFQKFLTYGGLIFDATVIPALWWRRTRLVAFIGLVCFNLFNSVALRIGVFPYMVLALSVFFFEPRTIERVFFWLPGLEPAEDGPRPREANEPPHITPTRAALAVYFAVQFLLPLRHHLYRGDVTWTEEGHRMSWRMMSRIKYGKLNLRAEDPSSNRQWTIRQSEWLTRKQRVQVATKPDMLYQFIQHLKTHYAERGMADVRIYAKRSAVYLNGNEPAPLYDPSVDLTQISYDLFRRDDWVLDRVPGR